MMNKKDVVEFLIGQSGNKRVTPMEKMKYEKIIQWIEQREKFFDIFKILLKED